MSSDKAYSKILPLRFIGNKICRNSFFVINQRNKLQRDKPNCDHCTCRMPIHRATCYRHYKCGNYFGIDIKLYTTIEKDCSFDRCFIKSKSFKFFFHSFKIQFLISESKRFLAQTIRVHFKYIYIYIMYYVQLVFCIANTI